MQLEKNFYELLVFFLLYIHEKMGVDFFFSILGRACIYTYLGFFFL